MKADEYIAAQVTESGEVKDEEHRHDPWGSQDEPIDREGETEINPESAPPDDSLTVSKDISLARRIDISLSPLDGIRLLPNFRPVDLPRIGTEESLIQPVVSRRFLDPPRLDIAKAFPALFGGVARELTGSLKFLDYSPTILNRLQLPSLSFELGQEFQSILKPIPKPLPRLVHPKARMAAKLGWIVHSYAASSRA